MKEDRPKIQIADGAQEPKNAESAEIKGNF
jgi:hypothetical protein